MNKSWRLYIVSFVEVFALTHASVRFGSECFSESGQAAVFDGEIAKFHKPPIAYPQHGSLCAAALDLFDQVQARGKPLDRASSGGVRTSARR